MIGTDVDRIPLRNFRIGVGNYVGGQPHGGIGREDVGAARQIFFNDIVLDGAGQAGALGTLIFRRRDVERQQPWRRGVNGHRGVHVGQGNAVKQRFHIAQMPDRHADLADLAVRQGVISVIAGLGRQIKSDGKPGLPAGQILAVKRV